jgi:hypothetical protein
MEAYPGSQAGRAALGATTSGGDGMNIGVYSCIGGIILILLSIGLITVGNLTPGQPEMDIIGDTVAWISIVIGGLCTFIGISIMLTSKEAR